MALFTILELDCHRLVGAFHEESGRSIISGTGLEWKHFSTGCADSRRNAYLTSFIVADYAPWRMSRVFLGRL